MATEIKSPNSITVRKLHPVIGAQIIGVELSRELDDGTIDQIKQAWYDHTVLLFRAQDISEDDQLRFAGYFGTVAERVIAPEGANKPVGPEWTNVLMVTDKVDENGEALGALDDDLIDAVAIQVDVAVGVGVRECREDRAVRAAGAARGVLPRGRPAPTA
mgnify:CR=1 FL=1